MFLENLDKLSDKNYYAKLLSLKNEAIVQRLCEENHDYFNIVEGGFPTKSAGKEILVDLPDNKKYEDKAVLGIFNKEDKLVAIVDIIKDYPVDAEWIIGLLMIDAKERGKGLGKRIHEFIKNTATAKHAKKLRIGVVQDNYKALSFWSGLGYFEVKRVDRKYGVKDNTVIIMNYPL